MLELREKSVLVVQSNTICLSVLHAYCQQRGFSHIDVFTDGGNAVEASQARAYDLVLLGVDLPGEKSGFSVAEEIKRSRPATRIIGVSAHAFPHQIAAGLERGMDAYVTKPVLLDELDRAVTKVCGKKSTIQAPLYLNN